MLEWLMIEQRIIVKNYFLIVKSILTHPRWLVREPISAVTRYSPNSSGGGLTLTNILASDTEYVSAGIGHWHGKPYCAAYFYDSKMTRNIFQDREKNECQKCDAIFEWFTFGQYLVHKSQALP